jgi:hypothetical protein
LTPRRLRAALACGVVLVSGCGTQGRRHGTPSQFVSVAVSGQGEQRLAHLNAAPGVRINARLRPALEFRDGTVITFEGEESATDSGYFAGSPRAAIGSTRAHTATLRASVCPAAQRVCLSVASDVDLPQ